MNDGNMIFEIFKKKPKYVCIGFLTELDMKLLMVCNIIHASPKHILFLECDCVECYIEMEWE